MSRKDLTRLAKLTRELSESELMLESLRRYQAEIADLVNGVPGSVNDIASDIRQLETSIDKLREATNSERANLERFISRVPDSRAQAYMRLHFLKGLSWEDVARITKAKSAAVVREMVQAGMRKVVHEGAETPITLESMAEVAALSKEISRKELILKSVQDQLGRGDLESDVEESDIMELVSEVAQLRDSRRERLADIEAFISTVDEPVVQTLLRLRYLRGLEWREVAQIACATSDNAARTRVSRYMKARGIKVNDMA
jgi:methyl-accepting chemotaxis protein